MADRPTQILDAAARLFRERGFHGVSVDQIGAEVGITGGALYHHFSGKDEILATLLTEAMDMVVLDPSHAFEDPQQELDFVIRHHARFVVTNRELVAIYAQEHRALVEPYKQWFVRRMQVHADHWEQVIGCCYPRAGKDDIALAVQAAIGMLNSVVFWPPPLLERDDIVEILVDHVRGAVGALADARRPV